MDAIQQALLDWVRDQISLGTASAVYLGCAAVGGMILLVQALLGLIGLGDHFEVDLDADAEGHLGFFSVRTVAAFLVVFGLVGWAGYASGWPELAHTGAAVISGLAVMAGVAWAMRMFRGLQSDGTVQPANAVGSVASVYLRIPGDGGGKGKITVSIQGRTMEFEAVTRGPTLPTGSACTVLRQIGESTFEVAALESGG